MMKLVDGPDFVLAAAISSVDHSYFLSIVSDGRSIDTPKIYLMGEVVEISETYKSLKSSTIDLELSSLRPCSPEDRHEPPYHEVVLKPEGFAVYVTLPVDVFWQIPDLISKQAITHVFLCLAKIDNWFELRNIYFGPWHRVVEMLKN